MFSLLASSECERDANISSSKRGHTRVYFSSSDPSGLRGFRTRVTRSCPRFPPGFQDGKEGVNGSSPLEGFRETPA